MALVRRLAGRLISLITGLPVDESWPEPPDSSRSRQADGPEPGRRTGTQRTSRLSPGAAEIQADLARQQVRGDAAERARPRQIPARQRLTGPRATRRVGPRSGYRWGRSPGDRTREPTSRTPEPRLRPDRARPALNRDQARRRDEQEVRRFRQARRAREAETASAAEPRDSRLSEEAVEAQAALVRDQLQGDAAARAEERPFREPLRNRTRIGPLRGILKPRADLPQRDRWMDFLVTSGFVLSAIFVGGFTRVDDEPFLVIFAAAMTVGLIVALMLDYLRWHGSLPIRLTRAGAVTGLAAFIAITSIGRLGELDPIPLPTDCSPEQLRALAEANITPETLADYLNGVDANTGRLRRLSATEDDLGRAQAYFRRASFQRALGEPERALADIQRGLELDPSDLWAYVQRVEIFDAADCSQYVHDEIAAMQPLVTSWDDDGVLLQAAEQFVVHGYAQLALDAALRAAELTPGSPHEAEIIQGFALAQLGRLQEALVPLSASIERNRVNWESHFVRGLVHRRLGDMARAREDFNRAVSLRPNWIAAQAGLALLLVDQGQILEGLDALNQALELEETTLHARLWRGLTLLQVGDAQAARDDFIEIDEHIGHIVLSADHLVGLASAELALGNREQAAEALAASRSRPMRWEDEPKVRALLENLERELGTSPAN